VRSGGLAAAEALVELRRERLGQGFGEWAARTAAAQLKDMLSSNRPTDDGETALAMAVRDELFPSTDAPSLRQQVDAALDAFVEGGAMAASAEAQATLDAAEQKIALLERCVGEADPMERATSFRALRELDIALLESDTMANLLALGSRGEEPGAELRPLGDLFQRMTNWLVIHEGRPVESPSAVEDHFTFRVRRIRAFLHLVDADGRRVDDRAELRDQRRVLTARTLLRRVKEDVPSRLRRATLAAAARACDAIVREEVAEVSDIVLVAGRASSEPGDLYTMSEASMMPDLVSAFLAFAKLLKTLEEEHPSGRTVRTALDGLAQLAHDLPIASSPRVDALRHGLLDLASSLEPVAGASSLHGLAELSRGDTPLSELESAVQTLATLVMGARRRLGEDIAFEKPSAGPAVRMIDLLLERALRISEERDLSEAVKSAVQSFREELPDGFARAASLSLANVVGLPLEGAETPRTSFLPAAPKEAPLPAWMPPSRVLGGFYVTRAIGNGAVGSVFIARRVDAKHDPTAEQFALKVPEYSGAAARTLSEEEFMNLFREEAGALLALPQHRNIAHFVTFDAGARPKPILVMELVDGPSLERYLDGQTLDMPRALELLDGIAAGLEAMHRAGVAHLDVKPSNVIVRDPDGILGPKPPDEPVLVDFGLAGRALRPGCGTASYGAPEVWGHDESGKARAQPADVYAFGCLAYELLTGETLFEENNDMATLHAHLQHDGWPEKVGRLTTDPRTQGLAELIRRSIRRNADDRENISSIRAALGRLRPGLATLQWPIRA
jgi:catechol 2,3-dioxygenase-like lactoylglutathione lyase family enzyme